MKRREFLLTASAIAGGAGLHAASLGAAGLAANLGQRRALAPYDLTMQNAHYRTVITHQPLTWSACHHRPLPQCLLAIRQSQ